MKYVLFSTMSEMFSVIIIKVLFLPKSRAYGIHERPASSLYGWPVDWLATKAKLACQEFQIRPTFF